MSKNIFDHIKGVTFRKTKWEDLSEEDTASWSNYMISRFFSLEMDLVEIINEFQRYTNDILTQKDYYNLLLNTLPKKSYYLKYIKSKSKFDISSEYIDIFCKYYELGKADIYLYIKFLSKNNPTELIDILKIYGLSTDEINIFKKQIKMNYED